MATFGEGDLVQATLPLRRQLVGTTLARELVQLAERLPVLLVTPVGDALTNYVAHLIGEGPELGAEVGREHPHRRTHTEDRCHRLCADALLERLDALEHHHGRVYLMHTAQLLTLRLLGLSNTQDARLHEARHVLLAGARGVELQSCERISAGLSFELRAVSAGLLLLGSLCPGRLVLFVATGPPILSLTHAFA
ncbi:hypothetical protein [Plantibacter flavus]|uniref:hypothetical protein n=1 Tax=Plantibacter flavus TaxID=150123 RepID=UPI00118153C9|nr:hypothetical protein [Plantibacter flavus]